MLSNLILKENLSESDAREFQHETSTVSLFKIKGKPHSHGAHRGQ